MRAPSQLGEWQRDSSRNVGRLKLETFFRLKHFIVNREKARQEEQEEEEEEEEARAETPECEAEVDSAMSQDGVSSEEEEEGSNREQRG